MKFSHRHYLIILVLLLSGLCAGREPLTNQQLISKLYINPVLETTGSLGKEYDKIQIEIKNPNPLSNWLVMQLREPFMNSGFQIYDEHIDRTNKYLKLIVEDANVEFRYRTIDRNIFFRTTKYQREMSGKFAYFIKNENGEILKNLNHTVSYADTVKRSAIDGIENSAYSFMTGTKSESKFIKRLVEPVLVTVTTVGVVYLFYTLRSN